MMKLLSAASVLAIAAGTQAAPFTIYSYEAGNGLAGIAGQGFQTSGAGFYNRAGAVTNGNAGSFSPQSTGILPNDPANWAEAAANHSAYDSYFTLAQAPSYLDSAAGQESLSDQIRAFYGYADGSNIAPTPVSGPDGFIGLTADGDGQLPYNPTPALSNAANNAVVAMNKAGAGIAATTQAVASPSKPGQHGVFIAQLTVNRGAVLSGGVFFTVDNGTPQGASGTLVIGGSPVDVNGVLYALKVYKVAELDNVSHSRSGGNTGTGTGNAQRFGNADVLHLWIETQIPTPGTLALAGLGGLVAFRRRRA